MSVNLNYLGTSSEAQKCVGFEDLQNKHLRLQNALLEGINVILKQLLQMFTRTLLTVE